MGAFNETTRAEYQGRNVDRLVNAEILHGYDSRRGWAGYRQWLDAGRVVRKGEHGVSCLTVVTVDRDANGHGGTRKPRGFRVFHYDQTVELDGSDAARAEIRLPAPNEDPPQAAHGSQPIPAPEPARNFRIVVDSPYGELGRIGF